MGPSENGSQNSSGGNSWTAGQKLPKSTQFNSTVQKIIAEVERRPSAQDGHNKKRRTKIDDYETTQDQESSH
jgi:hypothetical protein